MKYNEDKIIKEISDYISNTYTEHYSTTKDGFQVQDMLRHLGIDKDFCQANAIKYLARYGKKNGKNRKDLLKAIHYVVLLMSSEDNDPIQQMVDDNTYFTDYGQKWDTRQFFKRDFNKEVNKFMGGIK